MSGWRGRLAAEADAFARALGPVLADLAERAGMDPSRAEHDVALEAYHIAAGFVAADRRITDNEVLALVEAFGGRVDTGLDRAHPDEVRRKGVLEGAAGWLETPSLLFSLLRDADIRDGTRHARTYYTRAMEIAHATVAVDGYTDRVELAAVEAFREMLLRLLPPEPVGAPGAAPPIDRPGAARPIDRPGAAAPSATATTEGAQAEALATIEGLHEPERSLDELLAELDELVGLAEVKAEVRLVADLLQVEGMRRERGLPVAVQSRHLVFTGNPGTGKTTVARLLAQIYRVLGVVARGHLVETDRSGLVAGFVGQTATRVAEVFDAADGGVLLIDEAYALARGGERDFGAEAIDTLVKLMEDRRDRTVVVVTGYTAEMEVFVESNPGLRSRFPRTIHFPDYTTAELLAILDFMASKHHYRITRGARERLRALVDEAPRDRGFGNARLVRNLFEQAVARQAGRVVRRDGLTDDELVTIVARDVPEATQTASPAPQR